MHFIEGLYGSPSRSGNVASGLPHGYGGCLCCGTKDLPCTIEMILLSTVLEVFSMAGNSLLVKLSGFAKALASY